MRVASRHRHEPARLQLPHSLARRDGDAWRLERGRFADEPFRLVRGPRRSPQPGADRAVRGRTRGVCGPLHLARQLVGHVPQSRPDLRPRPSGLRPLRRQSDARRPKPDASGCDPDGGDPADALGRNGHDLRLQRPMDRQAPDAARDSDYRLCRRPAARRRRDRIRDPAPKWGSLDAAVRWSGGYRWISRLSTSPTCPRIAFA